MSTRTRRTIGLARFFNALTIRDFRLVWLTTSLTSLAMGMDLVVQGWLVLTITDSPFWVGVTSGLRGVGHIGFGAFGGLLADRFSRRNLIGGVQVIRGCLLLAITLLVVTGQVTLWHALVVALLQGVGDSVVAPCHTGLTYDTVGPKRILNANATLQLAFHLTFVLASLLVGALINFYGVGASYMAVAIVYLLSPVPLISLRIRQVAHDESLHMWDKLIEGLRYAASDKLLRTLLLLSILAETFGFSYFIMLPVIARDVLDVGALGLGYLVAANSLGAFLATFALTALGDFKAKWLLLVSVTVSAGAGLFFFSISPWFSTSLVLAAIIGAALGLYDACLATILQLLPLDRFRGRILGLYGMTWGFTPLGGSIAGVVATAVSAPFAIGVGGVILVGYAVGILSRKTRAGTNALSPFSTSNKSP